MKQPISSVIKRRIKIATELRDALPMYDTNSWYYFNGMAITLRDLLDEVCGQRFDKRFGEKDAS